MRVQVLTFSFKHVPVFIFHLSFKGCLFKNPSGRVYNTYGATYRVSGPAESVTVGSLGVYFVEQLFLHFSADLNIVEM